MCSVVRIMSEFGVQQNSDELRLQAGAWLKSIREQTGLSQRELGERIGAIYYTFISQVEAGKGRISPEQYEAWARALRLDPRDFALRMLSFYEPATYRLIAGAA